MSMSMTSRSRTRHRHRTCSRSHRRSTHRSSTNNTRAGGRNMLILALTVHDIVGQRCGRCVGCCGVGHAEAGCFSGGGEEGAVAVVWLAV